MTRVTMSCGRWRGSDPRCDPTMRDLPLVATRPFGDVPRLVLPRKTRIGPIYGHG
jgi:hypothetical protein